MMRLNTPANDNSVEQWVFWDKDGTMNLQSYIAHIGGMSMVEAGDLLRETHERHARQYGNRTKKQAEDD